MEQNKIYLIHFKYIIWTIKSWIKMYYTNMYKCTNHYNINRTNNNQNNDIIRNI